MTEELALNIAAFVAEAPLSELKVLQAVVNVRVEQLQEEEDRRELAERYRVY